MRVSQLEEPWPGSQTSDSRPSMLCGADTLIACIAAPVSSCTEQWPGWMVQGLPLGASQPGKVDGAVQGR